MRTVKLDRIDINILSQLQRNGRITNIKLANAVSLSPSPCLLRVKRLEESGYITSYNAHVDIGKLGETIMVIECHLISGGYDYLLKFLTRGVAHYQAVMESILEREIGVAKYFSFIVIKTPFQKRHYPLSKLFGAEHG